MKKVRIWFYASTIVIYVLFSLITSIVSYSALTAQMEENAAESFNTAYEINKRSIYYSVNNVVFSIGLVRNNVIAEFTFDIEQMVTYIGILNKSESFSDAVLSELLLEMKKSYAGELEFFEWTDSNPCEQSELYAAYRTVGLHGRNLTIALPESNVYNLTLGRAKTLIYGMVQSEEAYFWINEIHDWDGGDGYATRIIYPVQPLTEGMTLSTNGQDVRFGNSYLMQLEGVRAEGEVYYSYYYEKPGSEEIAHKLTYSKLYDHYNWIISTGVYIDDIENMSSRSIAAYEDFQSARIALTISFTFGVAVLALIAVFLLERFYFSRTRLDYFRTNNDRDRYKKLAYHDELTGLQNRRSLEKIIIEVFKRARDGNTIYSVIMLDLDNFKHLNDNYGHKAGDLVLVEMGGLLQRNVRPNDVVARWGGEEFVILLPNAPEHVLLEVAERLRSSIESCEINFEDQRINVTASLGMSSLMPEDESPDEPIARADKAMYQSKSKGKNRITLWESDLS